MRTVEQAAAEYREATIQLHQAQRDQKVAHDAYKAACLVSERASERVAVTRNQLLQASGGLYYDFESGMDRFVSGEPVTP